VPTDAELEPNSICYITDITKKISTPSAFPSYWVEIWLELGLNSIHYITNITKKISTQSAFLSYWVEIWLRLVTLKAADAICTSSLEPIPGGATYTSRCLWVPGPILSSAVLDEVAKFYADNNHHVVPEEIYIPLNVSSSLSIFCSNIFHSRYSLIFLALLT
jgi:hypothetical protein